MLDPAGTPPCAKSRLPPPRPPTDDNTCLSNAPMSAADPGTPPGVCANTRPGGSATLATSAIAGVAARVSFCANSLAKATSRSENTRTMIFRPPIAACECRAAKAMSSASSSSTSSFCLRSSLLSSRLLRICSGTSQSFAEKSAIASDKLHSRSLSHFLGFSQQNRADLPAGADVSATARRQVEILDFDQPELVALRWGQLTQAKFFRFRARHMANPQRTVLEHNLIGSPFGPSTLL